MNNNEANAKKEDNGKAISFHKALMIPGVIEFSLCLFSAKLVFYVFLFWLPHYIKVNIAFQFISISRFIPSNVTYHFE